MKTALRVRKCACCREPFMQQRPLQKLCGPPCATKDAEARHARRVAAQKRQERRDDRKRREALKTLPALIAEAQDAFNGFIRERDREKGCFVCGRPFLKDVPGRVLHAGHVRSRGAAGHLRFTEDNCLGECEGCNGPHGAKPHEIKAGAIARIGQQRFDELEADNTPHKWTKDEVRAIRDHYRAKVRQLKKEQRE